jgi:UDP-N-acetylmuramoyl-tripeptide--D-alanyl-D-alanine ligase
VRPWRLSELARAVGGRLVGEDRDVTAVVTDSREALPDGLFVALRGERTDGARFVDDAFARGAAAVVVPEGVRSSGSAVVVASTNEALLRLAAAERARSRATVVAITGANGKTSAKDLTAAVLRTRMRTHASPGSYNNEIGLPMTILGAPPDTEVVVAEMGARRVGDVSLLCEVARPNVVVVTNVGVAHLGVFGSWKQIVKASAEPVEAVDETGVAVLNADDHVVAGYAGRSRGRVVTFGTAERSTVRAESVTLDHEGRASFELIRDGERVPVTLAVPGEHMVSNALAAAAASAELGVPVADAADALGTAAISRWRMETFRTPDGVLVVNDAYNANPESMSAALKTARVMAGDGKLIAVLGMMAELGPISDVEHERVGELAARIRVDRVIAVGADARSVAIAALREGVEPDNVASYDEPMDALADVRRHARPGDLVLFKGSRVAGLERLAEAMR